MKTIEEAAIEYNDNLPYTHSRTLTGIISFKGGVEFAQKWYSVEEELPETEHEANGLSKVCICKSPHLADEFSGYFDGVCDFWRTYPSGLEITVTDWRKIELL